MATIPGVPEKISRTTVLGLLQKLGFDPKDLFEARLDQKGVWAKVGVRDDKGNRVIQMDGLAMHEVFIRFE